MSDRGRGRGQSRGGRGASGSSGRGRGRSGGQDEKPKREAILDLAKYVDKRVRVKFTGGREVTGVLKGYDQLLNLVMDEVREKITGPEESPSKPAAAERTLGLVVLRGTSIVVINPVDGFEEIANPFAATG